MWELEQLPPFTILCVYLWPYDSCVSIAFVVAKHSRYTRFVCVLMLVPMFDPQHRKSCNTYLLKINIYQFQLHCLLSIVSILKFFDSELRCEWMCICLQGRKVDRFILITWNGIKYGWRRICFERWKMYGHRQHNWTNSGQQWIFDGLSFFVILNSSPIFFSCILFDENALEYLFKKKHTHAPRNIDETIQVDWWKELSSPRPTIIWWWFER